MIQPSLNDIESACRVLPLAARLPFTPISEMTVEAPGEGTSSRVERRESSRDDPTSGKSDEDGERSRWRLVKHLARPFRNLPLGDTRYPRAPPFPPPPRRCSAREDLPSRFRPIWHS